MLVKKLFIFVVARLRKQNGRFQGALDTRTGWRRHSYSCAVLFIIYGMKILLRKDYVMAL